MGKHSRRSNIPAPSLMYPWKMFANRSQAPHSMSVLQQLPDPQQKKITALLGYQEATAAG